MRRGRGELSPAAAPSHPAGPSPGRRLPGAPAAALPPARPRPRGRGRAAGASPSGPRGANRRRGCPPPGAPGSARALMPPRSGGARSPAGVREPAGHIKAPRWPRCLCNAEAARKGAAPSPKRPPKGPHAPAQAPCPGRGAARLDECR